MSDGEFDLIDITSVGSFRHNGQYLNIKETENFNIDYNKGWGKIPEDKSLNGNMI